MQEPFLRPRAAPPPAALLFPRLADPSSHSEPTSNLLLAALPVEELARWRSRLEPVDLHLGQVLYESGRLQSHIYFPTTAIVSLQYITEHGRSAEIAMVGNEGVVGMALFMGGETTPSRAVVRNAGLGYRLAAGSVRNGFGQSAPVLQLLLRYTQALLTQMGQTGVCNRHHSLMQHLCAWLLMSLDRLEGNEVNMTHELIASMLGVRREGVTDAAIKLQRAGLISYSRGRLEVLDRRGLQACACECYAVVAGEYARLRPMHAEGGCACSASAFGELA